MAELQDKTPSSSPPVPKFPAPRVPLGLLSQAAMSPGKMRVMLDAAQLHLKGPQLRPELERQEDPTPFLLVGRLESPPGEACEEEVGEDADGDEDTRTKVAVEEQLLHQSCVEEDIYGGKNGVEEEQLY